MNERPEAPLDLRLLQAFVVVAEERHYGRAAERLAIAQLPLSRQIIQLEVRPGVRLFERDSAPGALTPDGQILLTEAYALLKHAADVRDKLRELGRLERPESQCS